ncbi:MAG: 1,4-alpha-glucan branching protein domain-containing protein [Polyangiaceae bacterium]
MSPSTPPLGHVALVLHAHLPYVRHPEHERSLEERWLHEAVWETYLPLVEMLDRLESEGICAPFSISVSPPLAAMWRDAMLRERSRAHLVRTRALALHLRGSLGDGPFGAALRHHEALLDRAAATLDRHGGDLLGALVHHHRGGRIHLFTTTATHAFLPGLAPDPSWARAQIRVGRAAFRAMTGIDARGLWLPECAFARWIDPLLGEAGVGFTALDAHGVALASPRPSVVTLPGRPRHGTSNGGAQQGTSHDGSPHGTFHGGPLTVPPLGIRSSAGVAYYGRDLWAGRSVWAMDGYPSDPEYREFHRDVGFDLDEGSLLGEVGPFGARVATGIKLHRITGGPDKAPYDPERGSLRAREHAARFVADRARLFATLRASGASWPAPPLSMVPFDAELFGHFWHEGVVFLEEVLRRLARVPGGSGPLAVSLAEREEQCPANVRAEPAESTWGEGGFAATWTGPRTASLWRHVHHAGLAVSRWARRAGHDERGVSRAGHDERSRLETPYLESPRGPVNGPLPAAAEQALWEGQPGASLAGGGHLSPLLSPHLDPGSSSIGEDALEQAICETLLLQSSDFPFMIHNGTTAEYAQRRVVEHAANVRRLVEIGGRPRVSDADSEWLLALRRRTPFLRDLPGEILRSALEEG